MSSAPSAIEATGHTGKIELQEARASLWPAASDWAVLQHTTQIHPDAPYLTKECADSTWSGKSVTIGGAVATLATAFRLEEKGGGSSLWSGSRAKRAAKKTGSALNFACNDLGVQHDGGIDPTSCLLYTSPSPRD